MTDYLEFFLKSSSDIIEFETIQLSHPNFTKVYYIVRNNGNGLTAQIEGGAFITFEYFPMVIEEITSTNDLDYGLKIEFGDLGENLPFELDSVFDAGAMFTEPVLIYRSYRSDNLTTPMFGPIELKIKNFTFNHTGCSFEAKSDRANLQKTGEVYTVNRFPMLRGLL